MTRDDPFEKLLREERRQREFPLALCLAAIAATGVALIASALGMRWGAAPPEGDALRQSWDYVNVAVLWTWLLIWPATALRRREVRRRGLLFDAVVLVVSAMPAMTVAAFLSDASKHEIESAVAAQVGAALLTMGILAWNTRAPAGLLAGITAMLAVGMPVLEYVWSEFFTAWPQGWGIYAPVGMLAIVLHPGPSAGARPLMIAAGYAAIGVVLMLTAPARRITL